MSVIKYLRRLAPGHAHVYMHSRALFACPVAACSMTERIWWHTWRPCDKIRHRPSPISLTNLFKFFNNYEKAFWRQYRTACLNCMREHRNDLTTVHWSSNFRSTIFYLRRENVERVQKTKQKWWNNCSPYLARERFRYHCNCAIFF